MYEKIFEIAFGSRAGVLNRFFSAVTIFIILLQFWRYFQLSRRIRQWLYKLTHLEQEAREEGVVTVTDPSYLPPLDPYARVWDQIPAMALMFGLMGTFIGLTLSLSEIPVTIDVEAIRKGLSSAIPSMGTAFWTSLCGLMVAIIVRITNGLLNSKFRKEVVDKLLMYSEPEVLEALESAAYRMGREGAILRPFGMRELLWHQNRMLNQTIARLGPQISGTIAKNLQKATAKLAEKQREELEKNHREVTQLLNRQLQVLEEQKNLLSHLIQFYSQWQSSGQGENTHYHSGGHNSHYSREPLLRHGEYRELGTENTFSNITSNPTPPSSQRADSSEGSGHKSDATVVTPAFEKPEK